MAQPTTAISSGPVRTILYENLSNESIEQERARTRVLVERVNLNKTYGVNNQKIGIVNGLGPAFIPDRTGTIYTWNEAMKAFIIEMERNIMDFGDKKTLNNGSIMMRIIPEYI